MSIHKSVAEILENRINLTVECIDRMYLNVYVPQLQRPEGAAAFFKHHRKEIFASSALMAPITTQFVKSIERFVQENGIEMVKFAKKERKDDLMQSRLAKFEADEGVVFVGKAQEKAKVVRTEKRRNPHTGQVYPWLVHRTALVNHYYFYCVDKDFGPFFIKFCSYFPYNVKLCINGHEYLKHQLSQCGLPFKALDNGILQCDFPHLVQNICDDLSADKIDELLRKWLKRLPHPFTTADRAAGYRYDISILQAEFSLTQVFDRPLTGRHFFEEVIRENLDLGRPDNVQLIFKRRITKRTPGRFRTRVVTQGVTPSLHIHYKRARIKQYFKEERALRTETTINNTRDFGIGKRLHNLPALQKIGFQANRRLLDVQRTSHDCTIGEETLSQVTRPVVVGNQRASALRFDDPMVQQLFTVIVLYCLLPGGFSNKDIRPRLAQLLGKTPADMTQGKMTYQLRRLRLHGIIVRVPKTNRYQVTESGLKIALFFTRVYMRVLRPGLSHLMPEFDPNIISASINRQLDNLGKAIDDLVKQVNL